MLDHQTGRCHTRFINQSRLHTADQELSHDSCVDYIIKVSQSQDVLMALCNSLTGSHSDVFRKSPLASELQTEKVSVGAAMREKQVSSQREPDREQNHTETHLGCSLSCSTRARHTADRPVCVCVCEPHRTQLPTPQDSFKTPREPTAPRSAQTFRLIPKETAV